MKFESTGRNKVRSVKACLLYDPTDGRIVHFHQVVTMEGAAEVSDEQVKERTVMLARERGLKTSNLGIMRVEPSAIRSSRHYAVNPSTKELIEMERPKTHSI